MNAPRVCRVRAIQALGVRRLDANSVISDWFCCLHLSTDCWSLSSSELEYSRLLSTCRRLNCVICLRSEMDLHSGLRSWSPSLSSSPPVRPHSLTPHALSSCFSLFAKCRSVVQQSPPLIEPLRCSSLSLQPQCINSALPSIHAKCRRSLADIFMLQVVLHFGKRVNDYKVDSVKSGVLKRK